MTIIEKVRNTFVGYHPGTVFTTRQIIDMVCEKHGVNRTSVIPSDYCYNMDNKGKAARSSLDKFKIFEMVSRGTYIYRGEGYVYSGPVQRNPRQK